MATPSSLLSEDQLQCFICLDVFTEPVTTSCGHNFCKACISRYWDSAGFCQCPMCNEKFNRRPELHINTTLREVVENLKIKSIVQNESLAIPGEVSCEVCTGRKFKALKSCLVCLASYCETHLEPHQRVPALRKHKLIDPVENLEDRMCKKHERPLELFCRTDQTCVCQFCTETDHKAHNTVPLEEECGARKVKLGKTEADVQQMIQERLQKVQEIKHSVELSKKDSRREISDSTQINLPDNPDRFERVVNVLGKDGFSSGRFYYEVTVKGKIEWDLGVASESINRKGPITLSPKNGYWAVWLRN
uniref:Uncharacterized protein n=1 Tax=Oncorhynchus mykiss TaxID=8022 RepID=A0A8C7PFA9_ONCMY